MHARATIGFDWLKKWRKNFEPITEWSNHKPKQFANYFRHSIENRSIRLSSGPSCSKGGLRSWRYRRRDRHKPRGGSTPWRRKSRCSLNTKTRYKRGLLHALLLFEFIQARLINYPSKTGWSTNSNTETDALKDTSSARDWGLKKERQITFYGILRTHCHKGFFYCTNYHRARLRSRLIDKSFGMCLRHHAFYSASSCLNTIMCYRRRSTLGTWWTFWFI